MLIKSGIFFNVKLKWCATQSLYFCCNTDHDATAAAVVFSP